MKYVTLEFQNVNQKIANLYMKDQYSQGSTLNEQQEEWKVANNSSKIETLPKDINQSHLEINFSPFTPN